MKTKFIIVEKENGEPIREEVIDGKEKGKMKIFETYKDAEIFCEENGIDYDYWKITEFII